MQEKARELIRRAKAAFARLERMRALYRDAYRLGLPHREGFSRSDAEGRELQREVFDSTFQDAVERLANALFVGMAPPWTQWFDLVPGDAVPEELAQDVEEELKRPARMTAQRLLRSNFYTELHPVLLDLVFGTGAMEVHEDPERDVRFRAVPVHELGLEEGPFGVVDTTFRRHKVLGRRLREQFPGASLPTDLARQIEAKPDEPVEVFDAVIHDPESTTRPWAQFVLWEGGGGYILDERRFYEQPRVVVRWSVVPGEVYGRGPALKAAANAYSLNEMSRLILIAANMGVLGMWTIADDEINPDLIKLGPGALIPVARNDNTNPSLRELVPQTRLDWGEFVKDDLRSQVQRNLYRDNLGNVEGPKMTATEVVERQALVLQDMGAAYGRISNELLGPVISRTVAVLARRGKLPDFRVDGRLVDLEYSSPLARAQRIEEAQAMRALYLDAAQLAQFDPSAAARIDTGKLLRRLAIISGVDPEVIRDDEEVQEIMNRIAQASMAAMGAGEAATA